MRGQTLEAQGTFDLVLIGPDHLEKRVTTVDWGEGQYANFATKHPPGITFSPDGTALYYTEMIADTLFVKRIRTDGFDEKTLYKFPHSVRAVVSPDLKWIAFREYTRTFVTPLDYIGKVVLVSGSTPWG